MKFLIERKEEGQKNVEFKVLEILNKKKARIYKMSAADIIIDIYNNDAEYFTGSIESPTKIRVDIYLTTSPNNSSSDNLDSLPTY